MSYLRNTTTGAVSNDIASDSREYRKLAATKNYEDVSSSQIAAAGGARFLAAIFAPSAVAVDNVELLAEPLEYDIAVGVVSYTPDTVLTGADTNSRTVSVVAGPDKASPIVVASLAFVSGVNAAAGAAKVLTAGTSAVPAGEPIVAKSVHVGTGLADPGGLVIVNYTEA